MATTKLGVVVPTVNKFVDTDGDGILDDGDGSGIPGDFPCIGGVTQSCDDNCRLTPNADQSDVDNDGKGDVCDNCPFASNVDQADTDGDLVGDTCDNCPSGQNSQNPIATGPSDPNYTLCANGTTYNIGQQCDSDTDGKGDVCDNCPLTPNANQSDSDICQASYDFLDPVPSCTLNNPLPDGKGDACDNCLSVFNAIAADGADLGRNLVDNDHITVMLDGVHHSPRFIFAGTTLNCALHTGFLL